MVAKFAPEIGRAIHRRTENTHSVSKNVHGTKELYLEGKDERDPYSFCIKNIGNCVLNMGHICQS